jgi:hypothetical protein
MPVITDSSAQSHAELKALLVAMLADFGGLNASEVFDAGSIADGDEAVGEITVEGASLGDFVLVSMSIDVADLTLAGAVTATDTVTYQLLNNTGGAVDLASATVYVRVIPRTPTVTTS